MAHNIRIYLTIWTISECSLQYHKSDKIELKYSPEQYWTIQDNIGQYWTILGNIGQYWAILDNIGQYLTIFDVIIHYVTIPQVIYPFYQDLTIYTLFVWPNQMPTSNNLRRSFSSFEIATTFYDNTIDDEDMLALLYSLEESFSSLICVLGNWWPA